MENIYTTVCVILATLLLLGCTEEKIEAPSAEVEYLLEWGSSGPRDNEFDQPIGIAIDDEGFLYVSDSGNNQIKKFSEFGELYGKWDGGETSDTKLQTPMHITSDGKNIYVTEYDTDRVQKFSQDQKPVFSFGKSGGKKSALDAPSGVAVDKDGNVYVAGFYNGSVKKYSPEGVYLLEIGSPGKKENGKLNYPTDVEVGQSGNIFVADAYNNRVQVFGPNGDFIRKWGDTSMLGDKTKEGLFNVATGIGIDDENRIYAADFYNHRIQVFDAKGKFLLSFGGQGSDVGEFERPTDVAVDKKGNIYVVDWGNDRVQKFKINWPKDN